MTQKSLTTEGVSCGSMAVAATTNNVPLRPNATYITNNSIELQSEEYFPLRLRHVPPGRPLPVHLYIRQPFEARLVLAVPKGQSLPPDLAASPDSYSRWGFFPAAEIPTLWHFLADNRNIFLNRTGLSRLEKIAFLYDLSLVWLQYFFTIPTARNDAMLTLVKELIACTHEHLLEENNLGRLSVTIRRHDSHLYTHAVNVYFIALAYALFKGWSEDEAKDFSLAGLCHDIGMITIPLGFTQSTDRLSEVDKQRLKHHPLTGCQLLTEFSEMSPRALTVIGQHHENFDGSGYPRGLAGATLHPWARVLRIIDTFESLTSFRPWRPPCNTKQAITVMQSTLKTKEIFDPAILADFTRFLSST